MLLLVVLLVVLVVLVMRVVLYVDKTTGRVVMTRLCMQTGLCFHPSRRHVEYVLRRSLIFHVLQKCFERVSDPGFLR